MKRLPSLAATTLITALIVYLLSVPLGPLPPAGSFFHPAMGFWANAETVGVTGDITFPASAATDPVDVFYDERGVPHIFAQNDADLYFAQGYVTARDRLFQMELQIRAAGGTLSEWLGETTIEYDRHQRRLGMQYGAEQAISLIAENDTIRSVLQSYADGVNAYINSLSYETYPLEYKILNVEPAEWKPINTALLLKYMTQMLAGRSDDFSMSNTIAHFGEEFVNTYLSGRSDLMEPIVPPEKEWMFNPATITPPNVRFDPSFTDDIQPWKPDPLNGSNNWVVDSSKTAGGYSILSNDMHLNMSMPSIWYEMQLHAPGVNVYGVTLQGTPTVIVGFNEAIAWGLTNTGADVMDWYSITFRDETKTEYLHDGEWLSVSERIETIRVKGGPAITDTLIFTHHGPVYESGEITPDSETIQQNHALRWIAHDQSNELLTFYKLNRAQDYSDFKESFLTYKAPSQNINFAAVDGDIALQTVGRFPLKWQFQGRSVSNGADSRYDWNDFIPYEQNPYSLNPGRGFLSAANQYPASPDYPYYLGESFAPFERGRRINDLLGEMESIRVDDFEEMLMDNFSYHAYRLLPALQLAVPADSLSDEEQLYLSRLDDWDFFNEAEAVEPTIFHYWWQQFYDHLWANKYDTIYPMTRPDRDLTVDLVVSNPESVWYDNVHTNKVEALGDIALGSFRDAIDQLTNEHGSDSDNWQWGAVRNTNLGHIGSIPGMGVKNLFTGGGAESINAIRGSHGPSWRMVVELDPDGVRGYGVYPGGQSGNPGSKTYDEFVNTWLEGELYELTFLREKPQERDDFPLLVRFE
ncbi:penicillin acylase family protein [Rhodohalobacter sp. 8-1]|uniref:penicillin acylase family protein n=1 Tax=Rhodohalobacter sp. 8-1 TaxID=3131972 RepID=UPI0030EC3464